MINKKSIRKKSNVIFYTIISCYLFIAIFAPLIANDQPLFVSIQGNHFFPAFSSSPYINLPGKNNLPVKTRKNSIDWKNLPADNIIFAPVCWSPSHSDLQNSYSSPFAKQEYFKNESLAELPFRFRHFLGTGKTGNDLLSGLIHGTRTSIAIGFFSMTIAILIGIILGGLAGYLGDEKLKIRRGGLIIFLLMILPSWFYSFTLRSEIISGAFENNFFPGFLQIFVSLLIFSFLSTWPFFIRFKSIPFLNYKIKIPIDAIISRCIEIFLSLPRLILILTLAAITRPSVITIILIIGFTSWTEIARLMRSQVLTLRELNYITAAKSFGVNTMKVIFRHLLPNASSQIMVASIFGIASAILTEAGLSFLGIGVPVGTATWGSLMFEAKENYTAWWMVVFTGLSIFLLLSSLYVIAGRISKSVVNS